jgi:hypothetical protein
MNDDEIKIIWQIRHEISEECGHDIDTVVAYYRIIEKDLKRSGRFRFAAKSPCAIMQLRLQSSFSTFGGCAFAGNIEPHS